MKKSNRKNPNYKTLILKYGSFLVLSGIFVIFILVVLVKAGLFGKIPNEKELLGIRYNNASNIISSDNKLLGRYYLQNRTNAEFSEIPENFINALVATEDVRFFKHNGVDFRSTIRVLVKSIVLFDKSAGGGSTLTQQLAKNIYPRKSYWVLSMPIAKIKEIIIAKKIERLYTKEEILELYLNTVSFGENTFGIETASLVFFNTKPKNLSLEQSSLLVGLLKANSNYNPVKNPEASQRRRNTVLSQMAKYKYISEKTADSISALPLKLRYRKLTSTEGPAPYFREYLRHQAEDIVKDLKKDDGTSYNIYTDGLTIYTSLNANFQSYAEQAVAENMKRLQQTFDEHWKGKEPWKKNPKLARQQIRQSAIYKSLKSQGFSEEEILEEMSIPHQTKIFTWDGEKTREMSSLDSVIHHFAMLQAGLLVLNARSGDILAWVGGDNYKYFKYDHVLSKRQAGSTFKPIVYAQALESGVKMCDIYPNDSIVYKEYDDWTPRNSDRKYGGYYSVKGALTKSVNTVSAQLIMNQGIKPTIELAHAMGIQSDLPEFPSLALGAVEISLYELVKTYAVFLNRGKTIEPVIVRRIENNKGETIYKSTVQISKENVLSEETTQQMLSMLKNVVEHGSAQGLQSIYRFTNELAGKTGTTQNQTDSWFLGLTPDLVIGAWVGGDNSAVRFRSIAYGSGSYSAMPIFARFLSKVYADPVYSSLQYSGFDIPEEILEEMNCADFQESYSEPLIKRIVREETSVEDFIKRILKGRKEKKEKKNKDGDMPDED